MKIATYQYDTTRALFDGSVSFPGLDAEMVTAGTLPEIFERMMRGREFGAAELGLTFYLRTLEEDAPFVAVPAFPNRVFRHSCVFVNTAAGIGGPRDLAGKRIGEFGLYGQDSGVWAKGILMDEYGFEPERNRWVIGGLERPMPPFDFVAHPRPAGLDVTEVPAGQTLSGMLEAGEIDALFTANVPQCVLDGSPRVARLFPDFEPVERDYFARTAIFPMMHTIVLPRESTEHARAVYDGFLAAKNAAAERFRQGRRLYEVQNMVPWTNALFDRNRELFADDWWPYGISANRAALETYLRYHHEQGLSAKQWTIEEIFAPGLLTT
jgi:4,5-dihydroxyphthalate decarboxylase